MHIIERSANEDLNRIAMHEMARLCYTCGICVGDCPAARFSDDFNPRQIFLKVCFGIEEGLVGLDSVIWKCTTCYTCTERCPAGVKPLDVILALRNLNFSKQSCPESLKTIRKNVLTKGAVGPVTQHIVKLRQEMALPGADEYPNLNLERYVSED